MHVFAELVRSIQRTQAELVMSIEEKQRQMERWAGGFVAELEREIAELKNRKTDLENVARTDHIHFLKVRKRVCFKANSVFILELRGLTSDCTDSCVYASTFLLFMIKPC